MLRLTVLEGIACGVTVEIAHFPFMLGRSGNADLILEDVGVSEKHLSIELSPVRECLAVPQHGQAFWVNEDFVRETQAIRVGDHLKVGDSVLLLDLPPRENRSFRPFEYAVWTLAVGVTLSQFLFIYLFLEGQG